MRDAPAINQSLVWQKRRTHAPKRESPPECSPAEAGTAYLRFYDPVPAAILAGRVVEHAVTLGFPRHPTNGDEGRHDPTWAVSTVNGDVRLGLYLGLVFPRVASTSAMVRSR